jgi:hypothetical protein
MSALYHQLIVTGLGLFSRASGQSRVEETGGYWLEVSARIHTDMATYLTELARASTGKYSRSNLRQSCPEPTSLFPKER